MTMELVLTTHFGNDRYRYAETYERLRGDAALRQALPTAKGGSLPKALSRPRILVINADEGEPGTFKDRLIMSRGPHLMIEGIAITSFALTIHNGYVYIRGEFVREPEVA